MSGTDSNKMEMESLEVIEKRSLNSIKEQIKLERGSELSSKPKRVVPLRPIVGMQQDARWKFEYFIGAHSAYLVVKNCVYICKQLEQVMMTCRSKQCKGNMIFLVAI